MISPSPNLGVSCSRLGNHEGFCRSRSSSDLCQRICDSSLLLSSDPRLQSQIHHQLFLSALTTPSRSSDSLHSSSSSSSSSGLNFSADQEEDLFARGNPDQKRKKNIKTSLHKRVDFCLGNRIGYRTKAPVGESMLSRRKKSERDLAYIFLLSLLLHLWPLLSRYFHGKSWFHGARTSSRSFPLFLCFLANQDLTLFSFLSSSWLPVAIFFLCVCMIARMPVGKKFATA